MITMTVKVAALTYARRIKELMADIDREEYNVPGPAGPWVSPEEWRAIVRFRQSVDEFLAVLEAGHQHRMAEQERDDDAGADNA